MEPDVPTHRVSGRAKSELERARDIRLQPVPAIVAGAFIGWLGIFVKATINEAIAADPGYIILMSAVIAAAWIGGVWSGIVAVAVTFALNGLVFGPEASGTPDLERVALARQLLYLIAALATVLLVGTRRASRDRLADALDEAAGLAEAVEVREERLQMVLSASGTGFWEWDILTDDLVWSTAIFRQHGLEPRASAPPFPEYLAMIHPDDRERFSRAIAAAIDGSAPFSLEFRVVWADGSVHWTHGAGRVFRDPDGRPIRMLGTGQDITERRRLEEERDELLADERRAAEFREAFIDVVSHELRTPITTILGISQILARPGRVDDPEAQSGLLDDIRAEAERLHRLVEDLLVLSRVERGALSVDTEPIGPRRLLERIVLHEAAELPSIAITLDLEPDLPVVAGEVTYVEQVLRNLLGNAAKYTPAGTPVIVTARREGDGVAIRVIDDGPGVPPASLERIFELFYRDPDSARTVAGSGIGLFVCASLVEAMGGRIWARRRPEGGSEFGFTLRVLEADAGDDTSGAAPATGRASARDTPELASATEPNAVETTPADGRPA